MDQTKMIIYLEYVILAIILVVVVLPLFDTVTSIFIILVLFVLAMTLLYFGDILLPKKSQDFDR